MVTMHCRSIGHAGQRSVRAMLTLILGQKKQYSVNPIGHPYCMRGCQIPSAVLHTGGTSCQICQLVLMMCTPPLLRRDVALHVVNVMRMMDTLPILDIMHEPLAGLF